MVIGLCAIFVTVKFISDFRNEFNSSMQPTINSTLADKLTQSDMPLIENPENYAVCIAADVVGMDISNKGTMTVSDSIVSVEYKDYDNQPTYTLDFDVSKVSELKDYHRRIDENDNGREVLSTKLYLSQFDPSVSMQENIDNYLTFAYVEFTEEAQTSTV